MASLCINDPEIIGADVLNNLMLLDDERKNFILGKAQEIDTSLNALVKLKQDLEEYLPPCEEMVKQRHPEFKYLPNLGGKLGVLSRRRWRGNSEWQWRLCSNVLCYQFGIIK